ncbi:MAG: site-2 protease family protein [Planctomycetota bacterium]
MNILDARFRIARLFGINISVHIIFVIYALFQLLQDGRGGLADNARWLGMLFGIILLHELGHCLGARAVGGRAEDILLWPLGGLAYAHAPMRPWPQFVTVAAGPAVNVVFCVLSALAILAASGGALLPGVNPLRPGFHYMGMLTTEPPPWFGYVVIFYRVNLWLLAFNLLPIYPLDGGQIFQTILWPFLGLRRAMVLACQVGLAGAVVLGIWALRDSGGGILFFIAIFGAITCWQQLQAARHGALVEDSPYYTYAASHDPRPWWRRILHIGRHRPRRSQRGESIAPTPNPNPGGWEALQAEKARSEAELDRILKKVSEQGIHSLSYVERQRLEQITRDRRRQEREFQRDTRL